MQQLPQQPPEAESPILLSPEQQAAAAAAAVAQAAKGSPLLQQPQSWELPQGLPTELCDARGPEE